MIDLSVIESAAGLGAYVAVWNEVTPHEPADVQQQLARRERDPRRLHLLVQRDGEPVACGFAGPSQSTGNGFVAVRVVPAARRQGIGTQVLHRVCDHLTGLRFTAACGHVSGDDTGSLVFARRHGFEEVDRQVEQLKVIGDEPPPRLPPGIRFVAIAEQPGLLREAYDLAVEGYADMATSSPVTVSLAEWLDEEATLPEGSFVALAGDELVGYAGLCCRPDGVVEGGLTVVRRAWRRRGVARTLKQAELAWAAQNGITEVVTWTQHANEGMRALNELLGYVYRRVTVTVRRSLPLRGER